MRGHRHPVGGPAYDAATLDPYPLPAPDATTRIPTELAPVLDRPKTRTEQLTACARTLQAPNRPGSQAELAAYASTRPTEPVRDDPRRPRPGPVSGKKDGRTANGALYDSGLDG
ncbi:hypothetical protein ACFQ9Q_27520 [Streptomyces virginiae]|uniref:hypothetical protein n=1 Tax=Streptomyces virginiae TaxID=1961 RepID=UPI0036B49FA7